MSLYVPWPASGTEAKGSIYQSGTGSLSFFVADGRRAPGAGVGLAQGLRTYRYTVQRAAHLAWRRAGGLAVPRDWRPHDHARSRRNAPVESAGKSWLR